MTHRALLARDVRADETHRVTERSLEQRVHRARRGVGGDIACEEVRWELRSGLCLTRIAEADERRHTSQLGEVTSIVLDPLEKTVIDEDHRWPTWIQLRRGGKRRDAPDFDGIAVA
jgi:hypothetical protein